MRGEARLRPSWPVDFAIGAGTRDRVRDPSQAFREDREVLWESEINRGDVRVLVDEAGGVVDLVVNDHVQVLLGGVGGDLLEGELLDIRHGVL